MEDIRKSLFKLKKEFKHRVGGKKHAPDKAGDSAVGEGVNSLASLLRPDPPLVVSGHDGEGRRISVDVSRAHSRDPYPHPEPAPADQGHRQRKETDVDEKENGQKDSRLDLNVEVAAGNGSSHEANQTSSPPFVTSIPRKREPDGMRTDSSPQVLYLIIPLGDADIPSVHGHTSQGVRPDKNAKPASTNGEKSSWKSVAFASAKLLLRGVRDSADAFGPLKSVAGGLYFILENCEV